MIMSGLKAELSKAFLSKWFVLPCCIATIIAIVAAIGGYLDDVKGAYALDYISTKWFDYTISSCFKYNILADFTQPASDIFFILLPLLCSIPFSWTLADELNSGFASNSILKSNPTMYLKNKYLAAFIAGGCIAAVPIIANCILCSCLLPARTPDVTSSIYFAIFDDNLFSYFFYNCPIVFDAIFLVLNVVFCACWSAFVMSISFVVRKPALLVGLPYCALFLIKAIEDAIPGDLIPFELSPFLFLRGCAVAHPQSGIVIMLTLLVLCLVPLATMHYVSRRGFHE